MGVAAAVLAIILILLANHFGFFRRLSGFFHTLARPFWKGESALVGTTSLDSGLLRSKREILLENQSLKDENQKLTLEMSNYQTVQDDNTKMKEILGRVDKQSFILSAILSKPPVSLYDTLVVDAGSSSGVLSGAKVYADTTVLIGTVAQVYAKTSLVQLFSTAGETVQVSVSGKNLATEATGRGGGNFEMTFPHDVDIPKGTEVTTPGVTPYLVGIVDDVISDARDPLQKVLLRSPVNMQELKFVEVEK